MLPLLAGALQIAGGVALAPGRIKHDVAFGTTGGHGACWPG